MLDEYNVEIDEIDQHHVRLVVRALRLIVLGRTLDEAKELARAAIASRRQDVDRPTAQSTTSRTSDGAIATTTVRPDTSQAA
jgi:hypothetical protein